MLEDLERLAKAATPGFEANGCDFEYHLLMGDYSEEFSEEVAAHIEAANPQTILKLIAVAKAAKMVLEPRQLAAESPMHDLPSHTALKKALAALEGG